MPDNERKDVQTRFKKGQSGNPNGRPKGKKNTAEMLREVFFHPVSIKDAQGTRSVPKIVAAGEVCINNALKGDLRSFVKVMELAEKFGILKPGSLEQEITHITRTIVYPKGHDAPGEK
jgi:Family of unknown function (DUF5681)